MITMHGLRLSPSAGKQLCRRSHGPESGDSDAQDGRDALEAMKEHSFDLVISDMKMPRMNGFELLKYLKEECPDTAVIIMTAFGDTYTVKDALLLGADEYITKPFKSYDISLVVERAYWRMMSRKEFSNTGK